MAKFMAILFKLSRNYLSLSHSSFFEKRVVVGGGGGQSKENNKLKIHFTPVFSTINVV